MRVYLSGPITGVPDYAARFAAAEAHWRALGHDVVNPATLNQPDAPYADAMAVDLAALATCGAVALLDGWEASPGVRTELDRARALGLAVIVSGG